MKRGYLRLKDSDETAIIVDRLNEYTVRNLADKLKMSTSTVNKIVNYRRVRRSTMDRLAKFLDVETKSISEPA